MKHLNKYQVLILVLLFPFILNIIFSFIVHSSYFDMGIEFLRLFLVCSWFNCILVMSKRLGQVSFLQEFLLKAFLILVPWIPFVELIENDILRPILFGSFAISYFIFIYFLSKIFEMVLIRKVVRINQWLIFIHMLIWPLGIWIYQDRIKEWSQN